MIHQDVIEPCILASASPRRQQLLSEMGLTFRVIPSNFDEQSVNPDNFSTPEELALHLAEMKGMDVAACFPENLVIAADTIVVQEDRILGKPADEKDAVRMLTRLSGRHHRVVTALALIRARDGRRESGLESTDVLFRKLSDGEIREYVRTYQPLDKAGAYGIQDVGAALTEGISGCYFNVVGFPITRFYRLWQDFHSRPEESTLIVDKSR